MPTGYTAVLHDKDIGFADFAIRCARAMGAMINMRDEPMDTPWRPDQPSGYYSSQLEEAQQQLDKFKALSLEDARIMLDDKRQKDFDHATAKIAEMNIVRGRYERMKEYVSAWTPPTKEHEGLKDFMLNQLSICASDYDTSYYEEDAKPVTPCTDREASDWAQEQIAKAIKTIAYCTSEGKKERDRVEARNKWVRDLQTSLDHAETAQAANEAAMIQANGGAAGSF